MCFACFNLGFTDSKKVIIKKYFLSGNPHKNLFLFEIFVSVFITPIKVYL
jgi:hypothetical protein